MLLCHVPDRLARRYAYQVLLLEEFQRAGVEVVFAKEPERLGTPEDDLLRRFQGMIAEYERAQIADPDDPVGSRTAVVAAGLLSPSSGRPPRTGARRPELA